MPMQLETPIQPPAIVAKEIVYFSVDLVAMRCEILLAMYDANGVHAGTEPYSISLLGKDAIPRFTREEYGGIKNALYRLLVEDGCVVGTVA